jgi:hypothetical protein
MNCEIGWEEAVARLAAEKTRAETCASCLLRLGDGAAVSRGMSAYGAAKAEVDAVIAGLVVALAKGAEPASLPELEARLTRGVAAREAFCASVVPLLTDPTGDRSLLVDLTGKAIGPLMDALKALLGSAREADRLTRATIQSQLEATRWREFNVLAATRGRVRAP